MLSKDNKCDKERAFENACDIRRLWALKKKKKKSKEEKVLCLNSRDSLLFSNEDPWTLFTLSLNINYQFGLVVFETPLINDEIQYAYKDTFILLLRFL